MEKKEKDKIIVCFDSRGHYGSEYYEVTKEEYAKLQKIEEKYGQLSFADKEEGYFIREIQKRKQVKIENLLYYC